MAIAPTIREQLDELLIDYTGGEGIRETGAEIIVYDPNADYPDPSIGLAVKEHGAEIDALGVTVDAHGVAIEANTSDISAVEDTVETLALTASVEYPTIADGLGATTEGGYFVVREDGENYVTRYQKVGGVEVFDNALPSKAKVDAVEVAGQATSDILSTITDQVEYLTSDFELYPQGHVLVLDPDGRAAEHYRKPTPSEMELWGDRDITVDGGGGVVWRSDGDPLRRELSRVDMELWPDAQVIVDAWGGVAARSDPPVLVEESFDPKISSEISAFYPIPTIAGVGHSMIAQGQAEAVAAYLATATGQTVPALNFGRSSNTARGVSARLNAYYPELFPKFPVYTPVGGSIPTSGPVTLASPFAAIDAGPWESFNLAIPTVTGAPGSYAGVRGIFALDSTNGIVFTRDASGAAMAILSPIPIVLDVRNGGDGSASGPHISNYRETVWLIWAGRNNPQATEANLAAIRSMVRHLSVANKAYVILPDFPNSTETTGTISRATLDFWNKQLKAAFPDNFCESRLGQDLLAWAIANGPNETDKANGIISTEWRTDTLHLNATGRAAIAPFIGDFIIRKNFLRF